jgi:predicted molibdopterin-dependent oxidoreductase YjgC
VVKLTINDVEIEAAPGARLLEVIKDQGVRITNLCYIDGLEPYAGCRTCLVDIAGARPTTLQLSCTAVVAEGMVVQTDTPEVKRARQGVMSLIMANHPDRCLTCHRRVHCQPGEVCLRDDVVTHRCLTCSKNYRCELQTSTELIDMGEFEEPWVGEPRSYYETPPPEPDRANPYLEFDPQMCIICTRCVRACADIRHTGAITLAGKGSTTAIAFGLGGPVHESDCDFCGACIDVCPTATLMEKPNKWVGLAEEWTNSACNSCAVGCTISYGTANGRPVIVRPDRLNAFSRDQICVRGRFHYDAVTEGSRLGRSLAKRGERLLPVPFDEALREAAEAIDRVRREHGPEAIAVLGSPLATNEEAAVLTRIAREVIRTPHLDFSQGAIHRAVVGAFRAGLGVEQLPASLTDIEAARTVIVVAGDLEESHNVASLRVKDAVIKQSARLIVVSPRWNELVPFAAAWLQPRPGHEAEAVQALAQAAATDAAKFGAPLAVNGDAADAHNRAAEALRMALSDVDSRVAIVFAPDPIGAAAAGEAAKACANLAIALRGNEAAGIVHYLPTDANVLGITDMGVAPGANGYGFAEIIEAASAGTIKALLIHDDNPLLNAPGGTAIRQAFEALDALVVIDSVRSTTAELADVVLAEVPFFAKDGTLTNADRRIVRQRPAAGPNREERDGLAILAALAAALGRDLEVTDAAGVMRESATRVPGYVRYAQLQSGRTRALAGATAGMPQVQPVATGPAQPGGEGLQLTTGRTLYTSWEGASMRSEEADKLHREEAALLHPSDAEAAGIRAGDTVVLSDGTNERRITARIDDGVAKGTVFVPQYYDGGAVMALYPLEGAGPASVFVRARALQPA